MNVEQIEQRIKDLKNEIHSLDSLKDSYDDVNSHCIEDQIDYLIKERNSLIELLESSFDNMIGL
jgi:ferritin-like metal-binding protein YciE